MKIFNARGGFSKREKWREKKSQSKAGKSDSHWSLFRLSRLFLGPMFWFCVRLPKSLFSYLFKFLLPSQELRSLCSWVNANFISGDVISCFEFVDFMLSTSSISQYHN